MYKYRHANLHYPQSKIYQENVSVHCRFYEKENETFDHLLTECSCFQQAPTLTSWTTNPWWTLYASETMTSYTARWCCFTIVCGWNSTCNTIYDLWDRPSGTTLDWIGLRFIWLYLSRNMSLCMLFAVAYTNTERQSRAGRAFKDAHSYRDDFWLTKLFSKLIGQK